MSYREKFNNHLADILLDVKNKKIECYDAHSLIMKYFYNDSKYIVEPLVKVRGTFSNLGWIKLNQTNIREAIDKTLKLAGLNQ